MMVRFDGFLYRNFRRFHSSTSSGRTEVTVGFVLGFLPRLLYWVLIGNVPFRLTAVLVLMVAVAVQVIQRLRYQPWHSLEIGSVAEFALLAITGFVMDEAPACPETYGLEWPASVRAAA
jgi:hypothetical protein